MRALVPALLLALAAAGCGGGGGGTVTATVPDLTSLKLSVSWPANPTSDMITRYTVTSESVDTGNQKSVALVVAGAAPDATPDGGWYTHEFAGAALGITDHGTYAVSVQAHNDAGSSAPSEPTYVEL